MASLMFETYSKRAKLVIVPDNPEEAKDLLKFRELVGSDTTDPNQWEIEFWKKEEKRDLEGVEEVPLSGL